MARARGLARRARGTPTARGVAAFRRCSGGGHGSPPLLYTSGISAFVGARVRFKPLSLIAAAIVGVSFVATSIAQPRTPPREITQVEGDLYRARNGNWYIAAHRADLDLAAALLVIAINPSESVWIVPGTMEEEEG